MTYVSLSSPTLQRLGAVALLGVIAGLNSVLAEPIVDPSASSDAPITITENTVVPTATDGSQVTPEDILTPEPATTDTLPTQVIEDLPPVITPEESIVEDAHTDISEPTIDIIPTEGIEDIPPVITPEESIVEDVTISETMPKVTIHVTAKNYDNDIDCGGLSHWGIQVVSKDGSIIPGKPSFVSSSQLDVDFTLWLPSNDYSEIMFTCSGNGENLAFQYGSLLNDVSGNQIIFSYIDTASASLFIDVSDKNIPIISEGVMLDDEEALPEVLLNEILSIEQGEPAGEGDILADDIAEPEMTLPVLPEDIPGETSEIIPTDTNTYIPPTHEIIEEILPPAWESTSEISVVIEEVVSTIPETIAPIETVPVVKAEPASVPVE